MNLQPLTKYKLSMLAIFIVIIVAIGISLSLKLWKQDERVIEWDARSYYAYLPMVFIHHDIQIKDYDKYKYGENKFWIWPIDTKEGKRIIKTTNGLSYLYAPAFFITHISAHLFGYEANGFTPPYKIALIINALLFLWLGLLFLKKTLIILRFNDTVTAITLLLIGLATNLLCYSAQTPAYSHVYSFSLISVFIYYVLSWYQNKSLGKTVILGLTYGLITLIRPTNFLIGFLFILYGVHNWTDAKNRVSYLINNWKSISIIGILCLLIWLPQIYYWKSITGHFFFNSYVGERFYFLNSQMNKGLFSFQKGWLVYTPVMSFFIVGLFFTKEKIKELVFSIFITTLFLIFITFAWWCWWYGGSFGQRALIDFYALFSIPMASFINKILGKRKLYRILFFTLSLFFIWLNIFQTYQYEYGSLHYDGMTAKLYFKQFGKLKQIQEFDKYINYPDYDKARNGGVKTINDKLNSNIKTDFIEEVLKDREIIPFSELDSGRVMVAFTFGQSNASNHGSDRYIPHGKVYNFYRNKLYKGKDPLLGCDGTGGSVWGILGDMLIDSNVYDKVVIVPVAIGSTLISDWTKGYCANRVMRVLEELKACNILITHIFWHQGESDNIFNTTSLNYQASLKKIVDLFRSKKIQAPFFVSIASYFPSATTKPLGIDSIIQNAQIQFIRSHHNVFFGPNTDKLNYAIHRYDGAHFSAFGMKEYAKLWYKSILKKQE